MEAFPPNPFSFSYLQESLNNLRCLKSAASVSISGVSIFDTLAGLETSWTTSSTIVGSVTKESIVPSKAFLTTCLSELDSMLLVITIVLLLEVIEELDSLGVPDSFETKLNDEHDGTNDNEEVAGDTLPEKSKKEKILN